MREGGWLAGWGSVQFQRLLHQHNAAMANQSGATIVILRLFIWKDYCIPHSLSKVALKGKAKIWQYRLRPEPIGKVKRRNRKLTGISLEVLGLSLLVGKISPFKNLIYGFNFRKISDFIFNYILCLQIKLSRSRLKKKLNNIENAKPARRHVDINVVLCSIFCFLFLFLFAWGRYRIIRRGWW